MRKKVDALRRVRVRLHMTEKTTKIILTCVRQDFDIFCKQTAGFVKPFLDIKKKVAVAKPKARYVTNSVKAGVGFNPLTDQATPKGYKKPEIPGPFFGFYIERKDAHGVYRFFCPLILTREVQTTDPKPFAIGELLAFWDKLPKKSGGKVEVDGYVFDVVGAG